MIILTGVNNNIFYLNSNLIECIYETPDTHITMTNGNKYRVLESAQMINDRIIASRARTLWYARSTARLNEFEAKIEIAHPFSPLSHHD